MTVKRVLAGVLLCLLAVAVFSSASLASPFAYIPNSGDDTVSVVDTSTNTVISILPVGLTPRGVTVSADGSRVYVTCEGDKSVTVINGTTNLTIDSISLPFSPFGVVINPQDTRLYVSADSDSRFAIIDTDTRQVLSILDLPCNKQGGVAVSPSGHMVYVALSDRNDIALINAGTNTLTGTLPVGNEPTGVAVSPDGSQVYVANRGGSLSVIDSQGQTEIARINIGGEPYAVAVSPDSQQVFIADSVLDRVVVVDSLQMAVSGNIALAIGAGPRGLSVSADGKTLYVANRMLDSVSAIDIASRLLISDIPVGIRPYAFGSFLGPLSGGSCAGLAPVSATGEDQQGATINGLGEIVWSEMDPATGYLQLFSSTRGQLTSDTADHYSPSINNYSDLVWEQYNPATGNTSIFGIISGQPAQLTYGTNDRQPAINDSGEVVYIANGHSLISTSRGQLAYDATYSFSSTDINNNGDVVWSQSDATGTYQIYLLNNGSGTAFPVTTDPFHHDFPTINDSGEIVWSQFDFIGMPRLVSSLRGQLTDSCPAGADHWAPDLNECGSVVFTAFNPGLGRGEVYLLGSAGACITPPTGGGACAGLTPVSATGEDQQGAAINGLGEIVWSEMDPVSGHNQLFSSTRGQLTSDNVNHLSPSINNYGDLVWEQYDPTNGNVSIFGIIFGHPFRWSFGTDDRQPAINDAGEVVYIENGHAVISTSRGQLAYDATYYFSSTDINNNGDVVWSQSDATGTYQIYVLNNGSGTAFPVTTDSVHHDFPTINDSGEIVWTQFDFIGMPRLVSSVRGQLTDTCPAGADHWAPDLNECGSVVFTAFNFSTGRGEIYLLGDGAPCSLLPAPDFSYDSLENPGVTPINACDTIILDASGSTAGRPIVTYEWDFHNDSTIDATGITVQVPRLLSGDQVTLIVYDDMGKSNRVTYDIDTTGLPPVAHTGGPYLITFGEDLVLDASATVNTMGCDDLLYRWTLDGIEILNEYVVSSPSLVIPWTDLTGFPIGVPIDVTLRAMGTLYPLFTDDVTTVEIAVPPPVAPSGLSAVAPLPTEVVLTWVDNADNETSVQIQRATDIAFTTDLTTVATINGATLTTYTDGTVVSETSYYYRVRSGNGTWSTFSNVAKVTTPIPQLAIATNTLVVGRVNEAYGQTIAAVNGTGPYVWSYFGLPSGLSLDPATGVLSGTPLVENLMPGRTLATFPVSIFVVDSASVSIGTVLFLNIVR